MGQYSQGPSYAHLFTIKLPAFIVPDQPEARVKAISGKAACSRGAQQQNKQKGIQKNNAKASH